MGTHVDAKWHKKQVKEFHKVQPVFQTYAKVLEDILKEAGDLYAPLCIVQARAKTIPSFAEKAIRKAHKYKKPVEQITDLCGARIITHFQFQADRICEFIKQNFEIDEANSIDVRSRLRISEFGYLSVHYIVTPKVDQILGIPIPDEIKDKKAEIQVRTLLQHTWADISHDRIYKTGIKVPEKFEREVYRLAALMENADNAFAEIAETIDYFSENYGAMMSEDDLKKEIGYVETILENETETKNKPKHALRLARLLKSQGDWEGAITVLAHYEKTNHNEILTLLGQSICQKNRNHPSDPAYKKGQDYLAKIGKPDETIEPEIRNSEIEDPVAIKQRAEALFQLGHSKGRLAQDKIETKRLLNMAHELDPTNPYYFAAYIEFVVYCSRDKNMIELLNPSIFSTIHMCREHIHMGIEQASAYFTMGRMFLLLGATEKSLATYSKAIDLCISQKTCIPQDVFDEELDALVHLNHGNKKLHSHFEWIRLLILLVKAIKFNDVSAKRVLKKKTLRQKPFDSPVLIIAGGASKMPKTKMSDYGNFIIRSLQSYEGTVISGGTTAGIPGLVGLATLAARRNENGHFRLVGYLPKKLPKDAKADKSYDELIRTDGTDFTMQEVVQYWIDLIVNGTHPTDVLLLGINGRQISNIEYRFALALGAKVGVVESSGRAATDLLLDEDWEGHERIIAVPHDALSLWAFANQTNPSQLSENQIEDAAQKVHENYLKQKIEDKDTTDPSMLPWEKLDDDLKKSNRQQVEFIENVFKDVGYEIQEVANPKKIKLTKDVLLQMAEMEHARWMIERLSSGWKRGDDKNVIEKISPYIVPWNNLQKQIQKWDLEAVMKFQDILNDAGYQISPIK